MKAFVKRCVFGGLVNGYQWFMGGISICQGCMLQSSALFPHPVGHQEAYINLVGHLDTVTLFYSCSGLHLHHRVKNKMFHSRLLLTFHWPLG